MKVAILSSFTLDLLPRKVDKLLSTRGLGVEWYLAPFGQYQQEILDPSSASKLIDPSVLVLAVHADDVAVGDGDVLQLVVRASQEYPGATILVHNFTSSQVSPMRFLEWNTETSQRATLARANISLADIVRGLRNVYVLDIESLVLKHGAVKMHDSRYYYLAKMHYSAFGLDRIAEQLASAVEILAGRRKKCLVVDLDNTMWGGIIGEDGLEGIKISKDGEGGAFLDFQRALLRLYESGTVLAICSKNDETLAMNVIQTHPDMALRKEHFATWRINWNDKASNLVSIAKELNIGLDSIVFLDDSRHERELVKGVLPEVTVPELPTDASLYASFVAELPFFEAFTLTREDADRSRLYAEERRRDEIQSTADSLDEFLRSLGTTVVVREADAFTIPRIAQLTQKTNQFNLTTRRYTEAQIRMFADDGGWYVVSLSSRDKIGDTGIVGAAVVEVSRTAARLDTFLMSCRVLGRGIEQAFLQIVLARLRDAGKRVCTAEYVPTPKNGMAAGFLSENGFSEQNGIWHYSLENHRAKLRAWIEVSD